MLVVVVAAILVVFAFAFLFNEIGTLKATIAANKFYVDSRHQAVERRLSEVEKKLVPPRKESNG
jgi:Tfp pilus assembly protein FimT